MTRKKSARIRDSFGAQNHDAALGAELSDVVQGLIRIEARSAPAVCSSRVRACGSDVLFRDSRCGLCRADDTCPGYRGPSRRDQVNLLAPSRGDIADRDWQGGPKRQAARVWVTTAEVFAQKRRTAGADRLGCKANGWCRFQRAVD